MTYDEIYSAFFLIIDKDFFSLDKETAYEYMRQWLHSAISQVYIRELFSSVSLDDEIEEFTYTFRINTGFPDDMFVQEILAEYMKIQWLAGQVDSAVNVSLILGGDTEKKIRDNYKNNMERLKTLRLNLIKRIKDYNTSHNSYTEGQ